MLGRDKKVLKNNAFAHTLIADGTEIKGDIVFSGTLHVQGHVVGNIRGDNDQCQLVIGVTGSVEGEIDAPNITVNGHVSGNLHSNVRLELASKADIEGNVFYNVIEMLMGARVNGKLVRQNEPRHLPAPGQIVGAANAGLVVEHIEPPVL